MVLPYDVTHALNRIRNTVDRETVRQWLEEIHKDSSALTYAILSNIHKVPAPLKWPGVLFLGFVSSQAAIIASVILGSSSALEWLIEQLAAHAADKGTLTAEQRERVVDFMKYKHKSLPKALAKE